MTIVTIPGIFGSGEAHWQTRWEALHPGLVRFAPADWAAPDLAEWLAALDRAVAAAGEPPLLVAHSLGCLLVAHFARTGRPVRGAFLVAVPDPTGTHFPLEARSFAPLPDGPLPFPALIVASADDPYAPGGSRAVAENWGAGLVELGPHGHLNSASGLGDWPEGWNLLTAFRAGAGA